MPFLATMPTTMIKPMNDERLNVVCVSSSARNTPQVESSAEESTAMGAAKSPNSNSSTMNTSTIARPSTNANSLNEFCCSAYCPPYCTRMLGGILRSAIACCTAFMPSPRSRCLEARRHLHVALQILAHDFGLARDLPSSWPASRASPSCPFR